MARSGAASSASTSASVRKVTIGLVEAFGRDRQHALDDVGVLGVAQRGVAEQRVDRGEAGVAGPDAVAALGFEVVEERADQRRRRGRRCRGADGALPVRCWAKPSSSRNVSR